MKTDTKIYIFIICLALAFVILLVAVASGKILYFFNNDPYIQSFERLSTSRTDSNAEKVADESREVSDGDFSPAYRLATITAYCLNENPMASGKMPYDGALACSRNIPLGTLVLIGDMGYTCEDRLALKYDDRFDIWMEDCGKCMDWGIRNLEVKILTK